MYYVSVLRIQVRNIYSITVCALTSELPIKENEFQN